MSDARIRDLERARATGDRAAARRLMVEECRHSTGHEIDATHWVSRGELRNVHGCLCGTYHRPCAGDCGQQADSFMVGGLGGLA